MRREKVLPRLFGSLLALAACLAASTARAQIAADFRSVTDTTTGTYGFGSYPTMNDSGTVAFYAEKTPGAGAIYRVRRGGAPVLLQEGGTGGPSINESDAVASLHLATDGSYSEVYKALPNGELRQVARTGNEYLSFPGIPFLADNGVTVFFARAYPAAPTRWGIFTGSGDGKTTLIVDNLGEFSSAFGTGATMNLAGLIAFTAAKDNAEAGLYVADTAAGGAITTVLTQDASPIYRMDGNPFINDRDQIALKAYEDNTGEPAICVIQRGDSSLQIFARAGGQGPEGPYSQFDSPVINNKGAVVFHANLDNGSRGIFAGPDPNLDKVVQLGDALFGSTVTNLGFRRGLNDRNEIAFYYGLADGRSGIATATINPRMTVQPTAMEPRPTATPAATPAQPLNLSTRARVAPGDTVLIGGFIAAGTEPKKVLIRAIGPSLPIEGALADPQIELRDGVGGLVARNDNWKDVQEQAIRATSATPASNLESAIVATFPANDGGYTITVSGKDGAAGIALVEIYDLSTAATSRLANLSTRGHVSAGNNAMIGGLIVGGGSSDTTKVIVRAIGPSLQNAGLTNCLADPVLELRNADGSLLRANDNWQDDPAQASEIQASGIAPSDPRESATAEPLRAGAYTAIVRSKEESASGVALVELYHIR